jgi:hypothetical protein
MPDHLMDELDRFWDAQLAGKPTDALLSDAGLGEAVRRFHIAEDVDRADASFVNRLWDELVHAQVAPGDAFGGESTDAMAPRFMRPADTMLRHRWLAAIAAALLIILIGGIASYYVFDRHEDKRYTTGPAINAPATPSPTVQLTPATLLDVVLPAEILPTGDGRLSGLVYIYVEGGATGTWLNSCCPGPMIEHVVAGEIAFTSKAATQVVRADGSIENIAAGTEVALQPGDTLVTRNEFEFRASNIGTQPVQMVEWVYVSDPMAYFAGHQLEGWGGLGGLDATQTLPTFPSSIRVTLNRLVLEPGDGKPPFQTDGIRQVVVPNVETEILTIFGDRSFSAVDSQGQLTTAYTLEVSPANSTRDLPIVGLPAT